MILDDKQAWAELGQAQPSLGYGFVEIGLKWPKAGPVAIMVELKTVLEVFWMSLKSFFFSAW